jgi:hypothetical protein
MVSRSKAAAATARAVLSAPDHLVAALISLPPPGWLASRFAAAVRDTYRLARFGPVSTRTDLQVVVYDAEIIEEHHRG